MATKPKYLLRLEQRFFHMPRFQQNAGAQTRPQFMYHRKHQHLQAVLAAQQSSISYNGKQMRKTVNRRTVDYNATIVKYLQNRIWQRDDRDRRLVQPDPSYATEIVPPAGVDDNPMNCVTTRHIRTSTNKLRCPIFSLCWTPEGRRLVTGASSGEFTLWNGLTFSFETILQAHDVPVRCMTWSHNDLWMLTADHAGFIKYWQSNMNNVKMYQAHKETVRDLSFCPSDTKFTSCSDDGTVRIWDFVKCTEERILRGHGADVKCVDWHPQKALIISGSKDSQQPIKLWDPRTGNGLATLHVHKNTCMNVKWNQNGNWFITASRDHLLKVFDVRNIKEELQTFKGHKQGVICAAWHPLQETLFASGGYDGSLMFWCVGTDKEVGAIEQAHDAMIWKLAWHPLGHILASGSNDHSTKFWNRNRPGDKMRDKYNLNTLPLGLGEEGDAEDLASDMSIIPGMGLEPGITDQPKPKEPEGPSIPGLDWSEEDRMVLAMHEKQERIANIRKKVPYAKPVPTAFQNAWDSGETVPVEEKEPEESKTESKDDSGKENTDSKSNAQKDQANLVGASLLKGPGETGTSSASGIRPLMSIQVPTPAPKQPPPPSGSGVGASLQKNPSGFVEQGLKELRQTTEKMETSGGSVPYADTDERVLPKFAERSDFMTSKDNFDEYKHYGETFDTGRPGDHDERVHDNDFRIPNTSDFSERGGGWQFGNDNMSDPRNDRYNNRDPRNRSSRHSDPNHDHENGRGYDKDNMDQEFRKRESSDSRGRGRFGGESRGRGSFRGRDRDFRDKRNLDNEERRFGNQETSFQWGDHEPNQMDSDLRGNYSTQMEGGSQDQDERQFQQNVDTRGKKRRWDDGPGDSRIGRSYLDESAAGDVDLRHSGGLRGGMKDDFNKDSPSELRDTGGFRGRGGRGRGRGSDWGHSSDQEGEFKGRGGRARGRGERGGRGRGDRGGRGRSDRGGRGRGSRGRGEGSRGRGDWRGRGGSGQ